MLSQSVLYSGREEPGSRPVYLTCGALSFLFDPEWAYVRTIRVLGKEAVRAVYSAVRDQYWNTVKPRLANLRIVTTERTVEIDFDAECREGEIDFPWKGRIRGNDDGTLRFEMEGKAQTTFLKNRIGFCVLHPLELAGQACTLEEADGSVERSRFPYYISPHQPFLNLRALSYELLPGVAAETRFEGDIFETEDQRNWTDASYKTYCTPLSLPYPAVINAGDEVRQSVTLRLLGQLPDARSLPRLLSTQSTVAPVGTDPVPLPRIGLYLSRELVGQSEAGSSRLRQLRLGHVRLDLQVEGDGWQGLLADGARQAEMLGTPLELAVHLPPDAERSLSLLASNLRTLQPSLSACLVFGSGDRSTRPELFELARRTLSSALGAVPLAGGSNVYFTELNRNRPEVKLDLACYPVTPQVHAFDDESLMETPPVQAWTVQTARQFLGSTPVAVTPVTLKPRMNPNVREQSEENADAIPRSVDFRQASLLGAAWTLASIKHLAESGVASVTYYETFGWKGVMETGKGSPSPFPSIPDSVYPLYHVFADIGEYRDSAVIPTISSAHSGVESLLLAKRDRRRLILANCTRSVQSISVSGCRLGVWVRVKALDETTVEEARRRPEGFREDPGLLTEVRDDRLTLALLPYAVVTVDSAELEKG